jgi:conjugal transfer/entry exclusion protein
MVVDAQQCHYTATLRALLANSSTDLQHATTRWQDAEDQLENHMRASQQLSEFLQQLEDTMVQMSSDLKLAKYVAPNHLVSRC